MTDHSFTTETSEGGDVAAGCLRIVCACGWTGAWMTPTLRNDDDVEFSTVDYIPELLDQLRAAGHVDKDPVDYEEELYQKVLTRLKKEGHI